MKMPLAVIASLFSAALALGQDACEEIVFLNANVIDGYSDAPVTNVSVHIAGGRIVSIGDSTAPPPAGARVIDLEGKWLMPGFVDAHVHFLDIQSARTAVSLGTTTVRTMHCPKMLDLGIRAAHREGQHDLPEVLACGFQFGPEMGEGFYEGLPELADLRPRITGTEAVRRVVRALASRGVDHIKYLATERAALPGSDPLRQTFSDEEVAAIVDEASRANLPVAAHAHGKEGAQAAVGAGAHSIEHGTYMSDETLRLMKQKGTFLVPTFTVANQPSDNAVVAERKRLAMAARTRLTLEAERLGVPLAGGSDVTYRNREESMADEARYIHLAGLSPMRTLQIITAGSARCLGIDDRTGMIKPGMEADILVLGANPLEDIGALDQLLMVINDGTVVVDALGN